MRRCQNMKTHTSVSQRGTILHASISIFVRKIVYFIELHKKLQRFLYLKKRQLHKFWFTCNVHLIALNPSDKVFKNCHLNRCLSTYLLQKKKCLAEINCISYLSICLTNFLSSLCRLCAISWGPFLFSRHFLFVLLIDSVPLCN